MKKSELERCFKVLSVVADQSLEIIRLQSALDRARNLIQSKDFTIDQYRKRIQMQNDMLESGEQS